MGSPHVKDEGHVYAVIMAGGAGTRFWPASRERMPKQFLPLGGREGEPLLASTVRRLAPVVPPERVLIATGAHLADAVGRAVSGVPRDNVLCEPMPRNTAPCIAWATREIARRAGAGALVAVFPSDHFIADEPGFLAVVGRALDAARRDYLATIGVVPTRPETGYGYIELGDDIGEGARAVARFVEKPDRARAEEYVAGKRHLWNAGMFFFRAGVMEAAVARHLPEIPKLLAETPFDAAFAKMPSVSIDHGVMEKADRLAVVPGDFGWNDVGSWQATWELAAKDAQGNALPPASVAVDARGNLVWDATSAAPKKRVALVGVSDLVVVETDDALLVIPRERAQDVRAVVDELKRRGEKNLL
jgi:mannose-1-phosphate guanylyltransferase